MSATKPKQTVMNPTIPYAGTILGGLHSGEMILLQGTVASDADRFQVDLMSGNSTKPRADIAFHFNPRFKRSPYIVCNTMLQERWGKEEIHNQMPFSKGSAFEIIILVQKDLYKVAVNGIHLLEYQYRMDLNKVDTLAISGRVEIHAIGFIPSPGSVPASSVGVTRAKETNNSVLLEPADVMIPYSARILKGLCPGNTIMIKGKICDYAHSFTVNLGVSNTKDLALHLNPRLRTGIFIRNSYLSDCWGPEENSLPSFPFSHGEYFEMIVLCDAQQFKVAVNGTHLLSYKHRVQDLRRIDLLEILGDLQLMDIKMW